MYYVHLLFLSCFFFFFFFSSRRRHTRCSRDWSSDVCSSDLGRSQWTIRNGRRCSAAVAFLRPAMRRANLTVETSALATRVLLEGTRATGVEYARHGRLHQVSTTREVLLAGGVFNTPQLLMLSGIGPADPLPEVRIPPTVNLPGVG